VNELNSSSDDLDRYSRQMRFVPIGKAGQQRLRSARVLLCGCGALGSTIADSLVRAGVGFLRIVDRDFVDLSNLQRQVLFDESDVAERLPKVIAATQKLQRINSQVAVEPVIADIQPANILELCRDVDLILDGSDNFELRFLINDAALETGLPWVYGGVVGSHGQTMAIRPGRTACLRCLMETMPEPGSTETCDTAGVLAPAIHVVASLQVVAALKLLTGQGETIPQQLTIVDVWGGTWRTVSLEGLRESGACPACGKGRRDWLHGTSGTQSTVLCGRNSVQISPAAGFRLSLQELAAKLSPLGSVKQNAFLLRFTPTGSDCELTIFRDGRAIIQGTDDVAVARGLYVRYIGG
jgi:molybdopterin-synthase adenylyltransferase